MHGLGLWSGIWYSLRDMYCIVGKKLTLWMTTREMALPTTPMTPTIGRSIPSKIQVIIRSCSSPMSHREFSDLLCILKCKNDWNHKKSSMEIQFQINEKSGTGNKIPFKIQVIIRSCSSPMSHKAFLDLLCTLKCQFLDILPFFRPLGRLLSFRSSYCPHAPSGLS